MCESISDIGTWYCVAVVADGTVPFIRYKPYRPVGSAENGGMSQFGFERPSRRGSYRREDRLVGNDERTATFAAVRSSFCGEGGIRTRDTILRFKHFPGAPLQPLEHLSIMTCR